MSRSVLGPRVTKLQTPQHILPQCGLLLSTPMIHPGYKKITQHNNQPKILILYLSVAEFSTIIHVFYIFYFLLYIIIYLQVFSPSEAFCYSSIMVYLGFCWRQLSMVLYSTLLSLMIDCRPSVNEQRTAPRTRDTTPTMRKGEPFDSDRTKPMVLLLS